MLQQNPTAQAAALPFMGSFQRQTVVSRGDDADIDIVPATLSNLQQSKKSSSQMSTGWVRVGEAYEEMKRRGWKGSLKTFRRRLQEKLVPPDLEALGLEADFKAKDANSSGHLTRWLRIRNEQNQVMGTQSDSGSATVAISPDSWSLK